MINGVADPGVLGNRGICIVHSTTTPLKGCVLQQCTKLDRIIDHRFFPWRQVNRFGITATFKIENAGIGPPVLIVSDQPSVRIVGKRRFTGTRKGQRTKQCRLCAPYWPSSAWRVRSFRLAANNSAQQKFPF